MARADREGPRGAESASELASDLRIARLADEWAIRDTLSRYWRGIDRRDPALVASTYHAAAYDDHGYFKGPVEGFVESLEPGVWNFFDKTQHFSGHIAIEFDPSDSGIARVESYAEAHHLRTDEDGLRHDLVYGLRYVDRFSCVESEWRIAHRVCTWDWVRTDAGVGLPLPESYARGAQSSSDPVFAQPVGIGVPESPENLIAKQACQDTLMRYARGVDRCDLELVRSAYHADAYDDHGGYQGDAEGFLAWVKPTVMDTFDCTMHKLGNCLVEVRGTQAYAETYAVAHHVSGGAGDATEPSDLIMGVRYLDRLEDRGHGWKIADRRMTFEWERSRPIGSQQEYPGFLRGRRDGTDPVLESGRRPPGGPATVSVPQAIGRAADRAEIYAALVRYCRGVDRRDIAMIRSAYHDDAYDDHGVYRGGLDGFIAFVERDVHARFRTTMHKLGQALIEFDERDDDGHEEAGRSDPGFATARAETYAICHHVAQENGRDVADSVMGVRYLDRFERRDGAWRIARRQLVWEWIRSDALESLDPEWTLGRAGPGDPVLCDFGAEHGRA